MGMLVGMGCMDKKFQHFFAPPFFKGFILIVLFFSISLAFAMRYCIAIKV